MGNPRQADQCWKCRCVLEGNQIARKHPTIDEASPELRHAAAQMMDGVISDKGGAENMSTLEQTLARQPGELWIMFQIVHVA